MKLYIWIGLLLIVLFTMNREGFANNSMLFFDEPVVNPLCTSVYSSSSGFVCMNNEQKKVLATRGGNRTIDADF